MIKKKFHNWIKFKIFKKILLIIIIKILIISCLYIPKHSIRENIKGLYKIIRADKNPEVARFSANGNKIYFTQETSGGYQYRLFEYNFNDNKIRQIYNAREYNKIQIDESINIEVFYVIDKDKIIMVNDISSEHRAKKDQLLFYKINLKKDYEIEKIFLPKKVRLYTDVQSQQNRNIFLFGPRSSERKYIISNLEDNLHTFELPDYLIPSLVCFGREENELVISKLTESEKINIVFYDYEKQKIKKEIQVADTKELTWSNGFRIILLSPDKRYLLMSHFYYGYYGIWLLDLGTDELIEVVNLLEPVDYKKDIIVYEWSWDSSRILMRVRGYHSFDIENGVYILDVEEFLKSEPKRKKLN